jgi:hypothetical protein
MLLFGALLSLNGAIDISILRSLYNQQKKAVSMKISIAAPARSQSRRF